MPEKEGGRSYDEISSEVGKSIDASGCLPADLRYLNGNRICTLPATMQGGDIAGAKALIGFFLVKAGGALIDNMAWLFVIGVGVGMADDNDGTAALAALASWLMITNLLSTGVVTTLMPVNRRECG